MTSSSKARAERAHTGRRGTETPPDKQPVAESETLDSHATRELPDVAAEVAEQTAESDDEAATVLGQSVRPEPVSRPRKNTLAAAITRPAKDDERPTETTPPRGAQSSQSAPAAPRVDATPPPMPAHEADNEIPDEVDEWSAADQPTVYLAPNWQPASRPAYLETGEEQVWPSRPSRAEPPAQRTPTPSRLEATDRPWRPSQPDASSQPDGPRLASPSGRVMPGTPPPGVPRAALPNPRMQRFQELHGELMTSDGHERLHHGARPVADVVRKWWSDLLPGLEGALHYQRQAKASGIHPIPAHAPATTSRLGDAFGRIAASARDLTGRAQAVASPALKRLHAQAEQAAQTIVEKIEGSPAQQQLPLLGPGRIAVFFKQGVTVGQAQKLLAASQARPVRLIPRKHGFLALVPPGAEAEVAERLKVHPYVRDVAYLEYDEYGEPVLPKR